MDKSVATRPVGVIDFARGLNEDQVQLIKDTICKGATNDELKLFIYQCEKRKLDPFAKQIYAIQRWNQKKGGYDMVTQTGIDGFRVVAERTGRYRGQVGPQWCGPEGNWQDVWLSDGPPAAARVGILREGNSEPIWGVATWKEYVQLTKEGRPIKMWQDMPSNQLAKCAESLGLRKAFPEDLSGIYTDDEMGQADNKQGQLKAEAIQATTRSLPAPVITPREPIVLPPETGDPEMDWIVPDLVKPIAGRRIGQVPEKDLLEAVVWAKAYFEKENKTPTGRWKEFFDRATDLLEGFTAGPEAYGAPEDNAPMFDEPGTTG